MIQWTRGFLRLWMVLSTAWIVCSALVMHQNGYLKFFGGSVDVDIHGYRAGIDRQNEGDTTKEDVLNVLRTQQAQQIARCSSVRPVPKLDVTEQLQRASRGEFRPPTQIEIDCQWWRDLPASLEDAADSIVRSNRLESIPSITDSGERFVIISLGPCVVLLVVGYLALWVGMGFAANRELHETRTEVE